MTAATLDEPALAGWMDPIERKKFTRDEEQAKGFLSISGREGFDHTVIFLAASSWCPSDAVAWLLPGNTEI
jgi:hypothetical protein